MSHDPNRTPNRIPNRTPTNERTNGLTEKSDASANPLTSVTRAGGAEAFDGDVVNLSDRRRVQRGTTRAPASYWADLCRANLAAAETAREAETAETAETADERDDERDDDE